MLSRTLRPAVALRRVHAPIFTRRGLADAAPSTSANPVRDVDVLIVGGGMVGAALACSLERVPALRVAVIDARTPHVRMALPEVPEQRVCAVTPTSERLLAELGAWDAVKAMRAAPYRDMQVWDEYGCVRYSADDAGEPHLGHIVENNVLLQALDERMAQLPRIHVLAPRNVSKLTPAENGMWVSAELDNGDHINARLVVGADGRQSKVRAAAGLDAWQWKYGQKAVICTVSCERPTTTAWQRFLPSGPLALLPMPNNFCNIVWSLPTDRADEVLTLPDDAFVGELNKAFSEKPRASPMSDLLPGVRPTSWKPPPRVAKVETRRLAFPLVASHANNYYSRRILVVGDAAHTVHPLGGQGLNLGLSDVSTLTSVVRSTVMQGGDVGSDIALSRYQQERLLPNLAMVSGCHLIKGLFAESGLPVAVARGVGLNLLNDFPAARRLIIKMASSSASSL